MLRQILQVIMAWMREIPIHRRVTRTLGYYVSTDTTAGGKGGVYDRGMVGHAWAARIRAAH